MISRKREVRLNCRVLAHPGTPRWVSILLGLVLRFILWDVMGQCQTIATME